MHTPGLLRGLQSRTRAAGIAETSSLIRSFRAADGYVRIWSTEAIYNTGNPEFASKPKQLASMSNHSGTIHTVRFSPNGRYLASGADDKIVCVYTLDANPPTHGSTFGRSLCTLNVESIGTNCF